MTALLLLMGISPPSYNGVGDVDDDDVVVAVAVILFLE